MTYGLSELMTIIVRACAAAIDNMTGSNIRRYVLYLYIETLKQRLDAINQLRVDRALAAMGPAFQQVYSLLPTLLHYHHPLMPGYLDGNVPKGICLYTPDETQRH